MKRSNQETFDTVVSHLRKQGKKSIDVQTGLVCMYRGPHNAKCAVGCLIPDEDYEWEMEGKKCAIEPVRSALEKNGYWNYALLSSLQDIHDNKLIEEWEERFEALARLEGLEYNPPSRN